MITRIRFRLLGKAIDLDWDDEASVYIATSTDVPGLVLHGKNIGDIVDKAKIVIPGLLSSKN